MSDEREIKRVDGHPISSDSSDNSNDVLATLLTLAGPNAHIDDVIKERIYGNVRQEWSRSTSRYAPIRWALPVAIAASVLLALFFIDPVTDVKPRPVGSIAMVIGSTADTVFAIGESVSVGDVLDTFGGEGLSIWLKGNISLRLDSSSLLKIDGEDEFTLVSGQVYVDTGARIYPKNHIIVHTASGSAVDIGTQFSVTFKDANMSVAVREGRVDVMDSDEIHYVYAGDKLTVRSGTAARFESVSVVGTSWDWAVSLAPTFDIERRSLLDFLKWASRETGLELEFESDELRMAVMRTHLRGSVEGMSLREAIESVFPTTQFNYTIDRHTLSVHQ